MVGGDLSLQFDLDVQQGLVLLGLVLPLCLLSGSALTPSAAGSHELFHLPGTALLHLPQAVLQAGLQIPCRVQVGLQGLDWTSQLRECHLSSSCLSGLQGNHCGTLLSLRGPVLV